MVALNKEKSKNTFRILSGALFFLISGAIASIILFKSPLSEALLSIDFISREAGVSQVFFAEDGVYSEAKSTRIPVVPGRNKLSFPLKGDFNSIRWDPLDSGAGIEVNDVYLSIFHVRLNLSKVVLTSLFSIDDIKPLGHKFILKMKHGAIDPQVAVKFQYGKIHKDRIFLSVLFGFSLALAFSCVFCFRKKMNKIPHEIDNLLCSLRNKIQRDELRPREIGWLMVIGFMFYSYFLSTYSLSIDAEKAAVRNDPSVWVSQGRWFVYLVEKYIFPQSAIPFSPYLILIASFAISYALILRVHGCKSSWKTYFLYPLFCAFPTWWFIAEFVSNVPSLGFGVFFISASVYLLFSIKNNDFKGAFSLVVINGLIVIMLACAMAAYQSLLLLFACIVLGALLINSQRDDGYGMVGRRHSLIILLRALGLTIAALLTYFFLNFVAQACVSADSGYIGGFLDYKAIMNGPWLIISLILQRMVSIYGGGSFWFGASMGGSGLVIILATLMLLSRDFLKSAIKLLWWGGILLVPFSLHFISDGAGVPLRTMLALGYIAWLSSFILMTNKRSIFFIGALIAVGFYQIQMFGVTSQYVAATTIKQAHDRMLAADIYRRIGELGSDFDRDAPLKMDVYGSKNFKTPYASGWASITQGSFFGWDEGNLYRIVSYMTVMGYENIVEPDSDERIAMNPYFKDMPIWPAAGSVRKVGDMYLVKLGREPDPTHAGRIQD